LDPATQHCYFNAALDGSFSTQSLRASDQAGCGAAGGHVVTLVSERENTLASTSSSFDPFWVNLAYNAGTSSYTPSVPFESGWSNQCPGCYAHLDAGADAMPVIKVKGDAGLGPGPCVIGKIDTRDPWHEAPCSGPNLAFITLCEREPLGSRAQACDGPAVCFTVPYTLGVKRYVYVADHVSANDAAARCASQLGGRLVLFDSPEEREEVAREVALQAVEQIGPIGEFWIGLRGVGNVSEQWDDGVPRLAPWGVAPGAAGPEPNGAPTFWRAYLRIETGAVDSTLAHAGSSADSGVPEVRPFVCQR
jgi:hypothetical protein